MDVRFRSLLGSGNHANLLTATTGFESTKVALKKGEGASPFALDKDLSWMPHLCRADVFVEPVERALPGQRRRRLVVAFRRRITMEAMNRAGIDIAFVR